MCVRCVRVKAPLAPLAGVQGAGVDAPAGSEHKLVVLEADAARDTSAGICAVRCEHKPARSDRRSRREALREKPHQTQPFTTIQLIYKLLLYSFKKSLEKFSIHLIIK